MTPEAERLYNIIKTNCKNGRAMTAPEQCAYFPEKSSYQVFEIFQEIIEEGYVIITTRPDGLKDTATTEPSLYASNKI